MFFLDICAIRGFTNNPTATQLEAVYKWLLVHSEVLVVLQEVQIV